MTLERDMQAAARGISDDLRIVGTELSGTLRRAWPLTLPLGLIAGSYLYLALRTSAGWTGAAILMGLATLILLIPCGPWMLRRWRRQRVVAAWTTAVASVGLPPTRVERVEYRDAGERLHVGVTGGIAVDDLGGKVRQLEAALGARVRIERDQPGRALITILRRDPFDELVIEWPGHAGRITDPFPVAIRESGESTLLDLFHRHVLIGGQTGFGKTNLVNLLIRIGVLDPHCTVHLVDVAKRGAGLGLWEQGAATFAVTRSDALDLLARLKSEMDVRWDSLRMRGRFETDRTDPTDLLVIDELAPLMLGKEGKNVTMALWELLSVGRAAGLNVVASMQKPHGGVIDTNVRDLFSHRFAFRGSTPEMGATVTGFPYAMPPSEYPVGVALMITDDGVPHRVKTYYSSLVAGA